MSKPPSNFLPVAYSNLGHFMAHLFMLLYPTVVLTLDKEFNLSYGSLLSLSVPGFIVFGAGALPAGWLGDRWGTRGMMAVFFLGTGAASMVTGLATSPLGLAVGLTLIGLFGSVYHPVGIAWLVEVAKNRGRVIGINGVFGNLGVAVAATVAGGLTTLVSWRAAFLVPGAIGILIGLAFLLTVKEARGAAKENKGADVTLSRRDIWRVVAVLSVTFVCGGLIYQATSVALPKVFADRLSDMVHSAFGVGGLVTMVYTVGSMAQILTGFALDRYPLRPTYMLIYLLEAPMLLLAANLSGLPLLLTALAMVFLAMGAIPVTDLLVARYTPANLRATVYGAKFVLSLGVASLGVPMVGIIRDYTGGFTVLFFVLSSLAAVVVAATFFLPREVSSLGKGGMVQPAMAGGTSGGTGD